jgi:hypothetical protein
MRHLDGDLLSAALVGGAEDGGHPAARNDIVEVVMVE